MDKQNQSNILNTGSEQNNLILNVDIDILFVGDSYGLFVFKKTERIVSALYLLSSFMSDIEPLKNRIRTVAIDMLETALSLSERIWGEEYLQKNLLKDLAEISTLFNLSKTSNMISKMNHEIIISELKKLSQFLIESSNTYSSAKIALEQNFFDGNYNYVPENKNLSITKFPERLNDTPTRDFYKGQKDIKDNQNNTVLDTMSIVKTSTTEKKQKDKTSRQDIIISMLKGGLKLTIKDFSKNIKGCSEKTIQRELILLVSNGVLKKEGERRWSKYFLA